MALAICRAVKLMTALTFSPRTQKTSLRRKT
jgi:hypothetical protein